MSGTYENPRFRLWWWWPSVALVACLAQLLSGLSPEGMDLGGLGGRRIQDLVESHLGSATAVLMSVLGALTALRSLKRSDEVKGSVRWGAFLLMTLSLSILEAGLLPANQPPLSGGTFGTYMAEGLQRALGIMGPLVMLGVFSLALAAWGGPPLRTLAGQFARQVVAWIEKASQRRQSAQSEMTEAERKADTDELPVKPRRSAARSEEPEGEEEDDSAISSIEDASIPFKNKPFDIQELMQKPKKKPRVIRSAESGDAMESVQEQDDEEAPKKPRARKIKVIESEDESREEVVEKAELPPAQEHQPEKPAAQLDIPKGAPKVPKKKPAPRRLPQVTGAPGSYKLPPLDLLEASEEEETTVEELQEINERSTALQQALKNFGLDVQVVNIQHGPVITQYELELAPGIKVSRVMNLQNDIAMALRARSVRILAPIPGKATVGVEVPNAKRRGVCLRDLFDHGGLESAKDMSLPTFLGRDIFGEPITFDVADMPHLLMAGSTGSGKSVGINGLILSLLMTRSPDEVKMVLVDPKQVELSFYKDIPHLISPVVTDMKRVPGILDWAVRKMEERYDLLARVGVRNIDGFNKLGAEAIKKQLGIIPEDGEVVDTYMPRIVIIIDELADLMMLSSTANDVESNIQRLAQKSRAVGLHVVLATQRPSVDVITGTIKANLPCRIAYMVNSGIDSRTILDRTGAETLLGKGDLLFKDPSRSDLQRLQGAFVSEEEVRKVVAHWVAQGVPPKFIEELVNPQAEGIGEGEKDELYEKAVRLVLESGRGSTTFLQRMLGVGYTRASRLIELMEMDGVLGPHRGSVSREILYTLEQWEARQAQEAEEAAMGSADTGNAADEAPVGAPAEETCPEPETNQATPQEPQDSHT
ncbi:MAG: DNA translocase FtsK 4TM domain-containing protein [Planctomycetota bacterium]